MSSQTFSLGNLLTKITDPKKIALDSQRRIDAAKRPQPAPTPVVVKIDNVDEAIRQRAWVESQSPSPVDNLRDCDEQIADLTNRIDAAEALLPSATEEEKQLLCGHREKRRPSLPGVADDYIHVPGTLERLQSRRAELERVRPLIARKAENFLAVVEGLKDWPSHRIAAIRNSEVERRLIAQGKPIQRRGQ